MIESGSPSKHSLNAVLVDIAAWVVAILLVTAAVAVAFEVYRLF